MVKRKRKKNSLAVNLKYEVYGILLITISVIALSGEAAVGRSLSKLFGLFLGKFYFALALVGIYVGLVVMVKRAWPSGWSNRKTGLVLFVLALTLMSAISEIDLKLAPAGEFTASEVMYALGRDIRSELLTSEDAHKPMMSRAVSGGYAGAIQYSILYWLFGYFGAKFVLIVMFAISVMLITGKSYVELSKIIYRRGSHLAELLRRKFAAAAANRRKQQKVKRTQARKTPEKDVPVLVLDDDDELDDLEEQDERPGRAERSKAKKPSAIAVWLQDKLAGMLGEKEEQKQQHSRNEQGYDDNADVHTAASAWQEQQPEVFERKERDGDADHVDAIPPWEQQIEEIPADSSLIWPDALIPPDPDGTSQLPAVEGELYDDSGNSGDAEAPDHLLEGAEGQPAPDQTAVLGAAQGAVTGTPVPIPYKLPSLALLARPKQGKFGGADASDSRRKLEATLESFGVRATVLDVVRGPAVTRYEVQPASGVKVSRIVGLTDDIALALAAKDIRMEAPIPGKSAIGIEVPNTEVSVVTMREVMETPAFQHASSKLSIVFGRDISGQPIVGDLAKMPHLLVAGATGSGKSVCINGIITSILYKAAPDEVRFLMIDPKMVELNVYNGIPHLLAPVVTDPRRASLALKKIVVEMEKRYELFSKSGTRNIEGYNNLMKDNPAAILPLIVVIVDELADLMMVAAGDVEDAITRLAQMARAAGIHLIIATQRPSVDVITGVIKANIPSRIAFGVSSQIDSRTILDMAGAEKLLGRGDMLFLPVGMSKPIRVQGAFLSDQEVETIVNYARGQAEAEYKEDLVPEIEENDQNMDAQLDELFDQAVQIVVEAKQASVSLLQRRMRIGYTRAARLIDQMEARSIVGPYEGSKPREVLVSIEQHQASKISS
ncbi:DNA translocase FtsK [Paenibacillaceae bacterium]|nr:DNA translocase FtsK [Paenibacillaceae bacterium]